jgi:hypothetical protein
MIDESGSWMTVNLTINEKAIRQYTDGLISFPIKI